MPLSPVKPSKLSCGRLAPTGRKSWLKAATLLALLVLGACQAPQPNERSVRDERLAAIQRWTRCIDTFTTSRTMTEQLLGQEPEACAGHRRDVIALYPEHIANRIDKLLSEHLQTRRSARFDHAATKARKRFDGNFNAEAIRDEL